MVRGLHGALFSPPTGRGPVHDDARICLQLIPTRSALVLSPLITVGLSLQGTNLLLSWNGGQPPYQVQMATNDMKMKPFRRLAGNLPGVVLELAILPLAAFGQRKPMSPTRRRSTDFAGSFRGLQNSLQAGTTCFAGATVSVRNDMLKLRHASFESRSRAWFAWIACCVLLGVQSGRPEGTRCLLEYALGPADNPLKGLVPYASAGGDTFPHSMEFSYFTLSALVIGYDLYDWMPLDKFLNEAAGRGHQAVFRVYLEWPGREGAIPAFLVKDGLKVFKFKDLSVEPPKDNQTPDYTDPKLRAVLMRFIAALGRKYDGDPRIGFITAGLLGGWGEWHGMAPRYDLFADKDLQVAVMDAYEAAFATTRILLRYPTGGEGFQQLAANTKRRFGYHDDSFAWGTLDTGRPGDSWFFMTAQRVAGREALDKWKTQPIGGEIRPEAWGIVFDPHPVRKEIQDFHDCVEATHVSWLMDSGMFGQKPDVARIQRAVEEARRMGYDFYVSAVTIGPAKAGRLPLKVEIVNRGVAPFYYDWPAEFGLIGAGGHLVTTFGGFGEDHRFAARRRSQNLGRGAVCGWGSSRQV